MKNELIALGCAGTLLFEAGHVAWDGKPPVKPAGQAHIETTWNSSASATFIVQVVPPSIANSGLSDGAPRFITFPRPDIDGAQVLQFPIRT
jgi:hypothetical protein